MRFKFFSHFVLVTASQASAFSGRVAEKILKSSALLSFLENKIKRQINKNGHICIDY